MDGFNRQALRVAVAQICQSMGWDAVQKSTHDTLTDVMQRYLEEIGKVAYGYTQICNRTNPNLDDLHLAFLDTGVVLHELENYVAQVDPVQFIHHFTSYPRCKPCRLQHPGSSEELVDRAEIYSEHLPPLPKVSHEQPSKDEEQEAFADENSKIVNTEVCDKMKTSPLKEVNQALEESRNVPHKRNLESVCERDNKRPKLDILINFNTDKKENVENTDGESLSPATPLSPYMSQEVPTKPRLPDDPNDIETMKGKTDSKALPNPTKEMVLPLKKVTAPDSRKFEMSTSTSKKLKLKTEKKESPKTPKKNPSPVSGRGTPVSSRGCSTTGHGSTSDGRVTPTVTSTSPTTSFPSPIINRPSIVASHLSPMYSSSPNKISSPTDHQSSSISRLSPLKQSKTEKITKSASPSKSHLSQKQAFGEKHVQHTYGKVSKSKREILSPVESTVPKMQPTVNVNTSQRDTSTSQHANKPKKKKSKSVDEELKPVRMTNPDAVSKPKLMIKLLPKEEVAGETTAHNSKIIMENVMEKVKDVKTPTKTSESKHKVKIQAQHVDNDFPKVKSVDKIKISTSSVDPPFKKEHTKKKKKKKDKDKEKRRQSKLERSEEPIPKIRFKFEGSGESKVVETKSTHSSSKIATKKSSVVIETEKISRSIITETLSNTLDYDPNKAYFCPVCKKKDDGSPMVGCDGCDEWSHWPCVGLIAAPPEDEEWHCPQCLLRKEKNKKGKMKKKH